MRDSFRKFRGRISLILLVSNMSVALAVAGMNLYLDDFVDVRGTPAIVIALSLGVVVAIALTTLEERLITRPYNVIMQALLHVSSQESSTMPSLLAAEESKKGFVHDAVESIFKLASISYEMTSGIEEQRAFLDKSLNVMPVGILLFDSKNNLKYANSIGSELIDFEYPKAISEPMTKLLDLHYQTDETVAGWLEFCRENKIQERKFWERVTLLREDNSKNIYDIVARYDKQDANDVELMLVMIDRTDEYIADEAELDFVALAAHELRSPITVIRGYLDVMDQEMEESFTIEQRALLQKMTVSAEMLSGYVNNILNVARVDQGHIKLHIRKADWRSVVTDAFEDLTIRAKVHSRKLTLDIPENVSEVAVDRVSITEVLNNLVDNAIKYSFEGQEVIIRVTEHDGLVSTEVVDQGVGIPSPVVGNLFKKFYRSHRTRQGVTGTGLGLYLSKVIVDSHGGNIWVRSTEGKGSTFGFEIPTYATIADTLKAGNNDGEGIKRSSHGWIKNHSLNRG